MRIRPVVLVDFNYYTFDGIENIGKKVAMGGDDNY